MTDVLLIDDHPVVLNGLRRAISGAMDLAVFGEARSGTEALSLLRSSTPSSGPDVLVLDITMPGGPDGMEVLRALSAEQPALPVLILSMHPEEQYALRTLRAGAAGYLTKAEAPRKVVEAVRQIAQGRRYVSAAVAEELATKAAGAGGQLLEQKPHERLSGREFQVLLGLARGRSTAEVASALSLTDSTVRTYRRRLLGKMDLKNTAALVRYAARERLVE